MKRFENKYYGLQACLTLFQKRPEDLIRVYFEKSNLTPLKSVLKWCAEKKKAYHMISNQELEKVTGSTHHEGVCFLAQEKKPISTEFFLKNLKTHGLLYLDGVENPHNLGSIVRSASHFNFRLILGEEKKMATLSPSACRVAKGGAEFVDLIHLSDPKKTLNLLKKEGYAFITTSSHKGDSLFNFSFPKKAVIVMGSESFGVSSTLQQFTTHHIKIPGTETVESLNVSVATALCLAEYFRQHGIN
jgi:TrmH RNA methyltransferase